MSKIKINKSIYSYLYDNLDILNKFDFHYSEKTIFTPIRNSFTEYDELGNKLYTIQADPTVRIRDIDKFHPVDIEQKIDLLSVGIDASTVPSQCLCRGNTRYLLIKPYIICASGEDAKFLLDEISQRIKFLILISDKLKLIYNKAKNALYPHYKLQNNLVNILKHIKEGKIFSDFIETIIQIAIDYGYKYNSRVNNDSKLIIYKDGSILSNSELKISHALKRGNFKGIEPFFKLYNSLKKAGENDIPVVGIVKDSQSLLLSKLFTPFGSDYHIVRNLALKQRCTYSYLSPIKKIIEPHKNIQIDNYFTFIARGISPLRLEVIPTFKPKNIRNFNEIIENTLRLIYQNENIHDFHNKRYKLPYCILSSDVVSRNKAKDANKLINEKLNQIRRNLPIPMIIKRGFE